MKQVLHYWQSWVSLLLCVLIVAAFLHGWLFGGE